MAGTPWTDSEERDLRSALADRGRWTQGAYSIFLTSNPTLNSRRTFDGCRNKIKTFSSDRLASERAEAISDQAEAWESQRAIIVRENKRLRKEIQHLRATNELMIEAMEESIVRLPAFTPPKPHIPKSGERKVQTGMLDISDVHGGELVRPEDTAGLGGYDFKTCKACMDTLRESILSISDDVRAAKIPFPKLVINFLGDIVTGADIYMGQARDIDRILVDQIVQLADELSRRVLYPFCQSFPEVIGNAVYGNHGRIGRRGTHHKRTNADYLLYHFIRQTMQHVENFKMRISLGSFMGYVLKEDPTRPHLIAHGDKIKRYMSIPYYGLDRWDARMVSLTQVPWAFTHLGHHHRKASIDAPHGERIMNGSWVGASEFSVDVLQEGNQPKQFFMGLSPEWGKTFSYDIYLEKGRRKLEVDERGLFTPIWEEDVETKLR